MMRKSYKTKYIRRIKVFTDYLIDCVSVFSRRKHLQKPAMERTTTQRDALETSQTQIYGHHPLEQR